MPLTHRQYFQYSPFFVDSAGVPDLVWEKLNAKIDKLPQALADLLVDAKVSEFIQSLTQKYIQLSVQGADVARLIRDVVIADVFLGDMPQEIQRRLGLDPATAREVANLIVSQVFAPVLEELKQVHRARFPNRVQGTGDRVQGSQQVPSVQGPGFSTQGHPHQPHQEHYQGEELPESGGNIINLRNP